MAITTANDLFLSELKDIYSAEKQAVRVYPRLAKSISSPQLKDALQVHLEETKKQIERLDRVFEILEKRSGGKTCEGMKGLIEEGMEMVEEVDKGPVLDAALIAAAQRMEHYEIAAYGTVAAFAKEIGEKEIVQLLTETLEEEKATDKKLTQVSRAVNKESLAEGEDEGDEDEEGIEEEDDVEVMEDDEEVDEDNEDVEDEDEDEAPAAKSASKSASKSAAKKSSSRR